MSARRRLPEKKPTKWPWDILGAVALGLALFAFAGYSKSTTWPWLQRYYFWEYVRVTPLWGAWHPDRDFAYVVPTTGSGGRRLTTADLSDERMGRVFDAGAVRLALRTEKGIRNRDLIEWLRTNVYEGHTAFEKSVELAGRWWFGASGLALALGIAWPRERERRRKLREGWILRGPEFVTSAEFTRETTRGGDTPGIAIINEDEEAGGKRDKVQIPSGREAMHFLVMGDTGSGKSTLLRMMLHQIKSLGDTAIVYDPSLEYTKAFYDAERGDVVLNPLDERMPYWSPSDEITREAEALTVATSLVKDQSRENPFFVEGPRRLLAHLLTFRPSTDELLAWLRDPREIDKRVRGTELAALVESSAPQQRAGVLSALSLSIDALKLLPKRHEADGTWSAVEWAKQRQGWIFLTSEPTVRDAVRLLHTHWLDVLILRLMNAPEHAGRRVWFILDELASLNKIPQLHTALTENRKSGNPVVIGFQGRSQLQARYGRDAEVMMSQPATKVFLKTTEPEAAEWISKSIGEREIERLKHSESKGDFLNRRGSSGTQDDNVTPRAVLASEVAGLSVGRGYLKHENFIVKLRVPPFNLPMDHSLGFIPRRVRPPQAPPRVPEAEHVIFE